MRVLRRSGPGRWSARCGAGRPVLAAALAVAAATAPALAAPAGALTVPSPAAVTAAAAAAWSISAPQVRVRGADLMDAGTGVRLWSQDLNVPRPMGSITKVMTALLVLRAGDLGRKITVTRAAVRYVHRDGASSAGLIAGDVLTARQLLRAMLLPSGCDAAYLLATSYGPGRQAFVAKMNAAAKAMGLTETHFSHFDGMPYPTEHSTYSSPADLVRLGEQAMREPLFRRIVAERRYRLPATAQHHRYVWYTTNGLLGSYRGTLGIKTGSTNAAGNCLVFEARRDGHTLIGVVLHANPTSNPNAIFAAAKQLLNWGFHRV
jgi:serine-type D-Ala-D-Ala carboxypeptidase (penicillin-binding protein 5/6)